jgi:type VI protein secretion system component VasA
MVVEASHALARLDAERLEELALSCQALNRELAEADAVGRQALAFESKDAVAEMADFARVLEATRANLNVMNRLRELREGRLEYGQVKWVQTESGHGNN